jgi:hypothetical protein
MAALGVLLLFRPDLNAQWKASGPGPFQYDDVANWEGEVINDQLMGSPEAEQTINFTTDRSMPEGLLIRPQASSDDRHYSVIFKARNAKNSAPEARRLAIAGRSLWTLGKPTTPRRFSGTTFRSISILKKNRRSLKRLPETVMSKFAGRCSTHPG